MLELQLQYTTYKNNLQQLAQKIGDVEQETEEHKYDEPYPIQSSFLSGSYGLLSYTARSHGLPLFCFLG